MKSQNNAASRAIRVHRVRGAQTEVANDEVCIEDALEIRLNGRRFSATMRTPGHDAELARGLLLSEGVIDDLDDIETLNCFTQCREHSQELVNIVDVILHDERHAQSGWWERNLISNASCGLCGKASIEALATRIGRLENGPQIPLQVLADLNDALRDSQTVFERTGGLHACGLFDANGKLLVAREDIGRHNATDKAIGHALEHDFLSQVAICFVSGRASFEIVQKALVARIPIVAAVSAASNLAIDLAEANNQTLIGWLRDDRATIYCGANRFDFEE